MEGESARTLHQKLDYEHKNDLHEVANPVDRLEGTRGLKSFVFCPSLIRLYTLLSDTFFTVHFSVLFTTF